MHLPHAGQGRQDGIVSGKTNVEDVSAVPDGLLGKGSRKKAEFIQVGDLPHHVVTQTDGIKTLIQPGNARQNRFKSSHALPSDHVRFV